MQIRLTGAVELRNVLVTLEPRLQRRVWGKALFAGAAVIRDRARALAPIRSGDTRPRSTAKGRKRGPGFLKRNIVARVLRRRRNGQLVAVAGTRGEAFYGRLVETGWNPSTRRRRATIKGLKKLQVAERGTSRVGPKPWLRPAFHGTQQQAVDAVGAELRRGLEALTKDDRT